jgi:hypothetical protein
MLSKTQPSTSTLTRTQLVQRSNSSPGCKHHRFSSRTCSQIRCRRCSLRRSNRQLQCSQLHSSWNQWGGQDQNQLFAQLDALKAQRAQAVNALSFFRQGQNRAKDPGAAQAAEQKVAALDSQIKATEDAIAPPAGLLKQSLYGNPSPQSAPQAAPPQAPQSQAPQGPLAQAMAAKAAQAAPPAAAQQAPALAQVQQALAAQAPQRQNDFVVDAGALQGVKDNLDRLKEQRQAAAMDRLYYSGPRGKEEYDARLKAQIMRDAKEPTKLEFKGKDGETQGYVVNGKTVQNPFATGAAGVVDLKPSEKVSVMKAHSDDTKALGDTNKQINSLNDGLEGLDSARKLIGDVGTGGFGCSG